MHVPSLWLIASLLISASALYPSEQQHPLALVGDHPLAAFGDALQVLNETRSKTPKHHCENIHEAKDPCKHALKYCSPESAGMVDYIAWYYCDMKDAQPLAFTVIVLWTGLLFSTIGIASSDFFCPNLATIANSLGMSQSVAGVTFLAFGNGSPDVFSTFAAFKAHSGSLAIGELLGAAAFITSVVAGAMAIIAPFKVSRRSFLRDAGFFLVAVIMTMFLLADGKLRLWESIFMIFFYVAYVAYVLIGTYINSSGRKQKIMESRVRSHYAPVGADARTEADDDLDQANSRLLAEDSIDISNLEANDSDEESVEHDYQDLNSSMSVTGRPMHTSRNSVRPSLLGALEFRELVTGMSDDAGLSPVTFKSIKNRPRAHSAACRVTSSHAKLEGAAEAATRSLSPELEFVHRHNHIHNHGHTHKPSNTPKAATDASPRLNDKAIDIQTRSPKSPNSVATLDNEDIASNSLRRHNPIELLEPVRPADLRTADIPAITINDTPQTESDPFANAWAESDTSSTSPKAPSYESMADRPRRPDAGAAESSHTDGHTHNADCDCKTPWLPAWWPNRLLPAPNTLKDLLFPTLVDFSSQTYVQQVLSLLAMPSVFILTMTLPVVNPPINQDVAEQNEAGLDLEAIIAKDDADRYTAHRGWNRWLTCVQCVLTPILATVALFLGEPLLFPLLVALGVGLGLLALVILLTKSNQRPRYHSFFCFIGFVVSVGWISTIANEVVGTLQAFGTILGLSDAILGLTVFAVGNSLGDFVADVTVAKMGFSQMAISGVFGGPMLNILLGIGISGIYINVSSHHVYNTQISPTLIVSGLSLLTTLVVLLIAVPANGYVMSRKLGVVLCCIFLIGMITSVLVEVYLQS